MADMNTSTFSEPAHILFADLRYIWRKARFLALSLTLPFSKCNANR